MSSTLNLGEYLRQEREKRSITIEQVASATKISLRLLHALEADQFGDLPAKPFVRGFVISYCRFVGMDPSDVITRYGTFIDRRAQERSASEGVQTGYVFEKKDSERSRVMLWIVMASFVVVGGVVIFVLKPALRHRRVSHVEQLRAAHSKKAEPEATAPEAQPNATATAAPTVTATAPPALTPVKPAPGPNVTPASIAAVENTPTTTEDPLNKGDSLDSKAVRHKVVFKALKDVGIRYKVDQKPMMSFVLREGRLIVLKGSEVIRFQASDSAAIDFKYNTPDYKSLQDAKNLKVINNTATLLVPSDFAGAATDVFLNTGIERVAENPPKLSTQ